MDNSQYVLTEKLEDVITIGWIRDVVLWHCSTQFDE